MTNEQPEAIRLADELDTDRNWLAARGLHQQSMAEAAAELRRLHVEDEAKDALLWLCREMLRELPAVHPQQGPRRDELIEALNKRLSNA